MIRLCLKGCRGCVLSLVPYSYLCRVQLLFPGITCQHSDPEHRCFTGQPETLLIIVLMLLRIRESYRGIINAFVIADPIHCIEFISTSLFIDNRTISTP